MTILGISCHYHESAAALIRDGHIVAAIAEERLTRKKHDAGFPASAIDVCRSFTSKIDYVVFYEKPFRKFERHLMTSMQFFPYSARYFIEAMRNSLTEKLWIKSTITKKLGLPGDRVLFVPQHISHAAASFYPSPFERAAFLTLDAVGEWSSGSWGIAKGNKLYPKGELRYPHSVGLLYSAFTAFLEFEVGDGEYKVMGMAAYGKPKYTDAIKKLFVQHRDGSIRLNLKYFAFHTSARSMYSDTFVREFAGCDRFDLAASIQNVTEEIICNMLTWIAQKTGETNVVFGGGVALNSVVNGKITKKTPFKHVFIFPAAGDDGAAVGAALYVYHHVLGHMKRRVLNHIFFGQDYTDKTIEQFLIEKNISYRKTADEKLFDYISEQLVSGKVVGWFEGRSEFGPRALGHRSILADPIDPHMKDTVNHTIKYREEFRPFAPVVLAEHAKRYYEVTEPNVTPYMLGTFHVKPQTKRIAAATVHVDGTSRIQTVGKDYPGLYRKLLEVFYRKTGRPILLNTSFNLKGEPIVETPWDAYSTFARSGIDVLVLENCVIVK